MIPYAYLWRKQMKTPTKEQIKRKLDTAMIRTAELLARARDNGEVKNETDEFMFIVYTAIKVWQEINAER